MHMSATPRKDLLRVSIHEHDVQELLGEYPKLSRAEVMDVIARNGPIRSAVEAELEKISATKR